MRPRPKLSNALAADSTAGRRLMSSLTGEESKSIPFLADLMGHKGLSLLMKDACLTSYQEDLQEYRHLIYYTGIADPR